MNRLLLDTSVFLWWQADHARLAVAARQKIHDAMEVFVSAASSWEVAIKVGIGKLEVPEPVSVALPKHGFLELPISVGHSEAAGALPLHHRDPFDRMLIAQARVENLVLVTADNRMRPYDVTCLWV
jgi:PIN domain nuclease of toxin-antitoxin system